MTLKQAIVGTLCFLVLIYAFGFLATGGDLIIYRFWAPRFENAKREVFVQTQSYVQGKNTYIARLRLQYETADASQKEPFRRLILSEAETISVANLTVQNRGFIETLRQQ
jgi:hypothetical protein